MTASDRRPDMRSPFVLDIADLSAPGSARDEHFAATVDWSLEMSHTVVDPPLVADLRLQSLTGGILVRGTVSVAVQHTCHRCLEDFIAGHDVPVSAMFMPDPDDDSYPLGGAEIDVEQLVRDEVLLAMPLLPRCREECAGVVSDTGGDLNTIAPGDAEDTSTSPFAVLRDLLDSGT